MSKEDYFNLVQELNKNKNYQFAKPDSQKSDKKDRQSVQNLSEVNSKRDTFIKTPQTVVSKYDKSKIVMKSTALNLLMEKSKLNEYMRFATLNVNLDSNDVFNTQDPSRMTFMNASDLTPQGNDRTPLIASASVHEQNDEFFKAQEHISSGGDRKKSNYTSTSRLPKIGRNLYGVLPKINSRERKPSEVSLYLQNVLKAPSMS